MAGDGRDKPPAAQMEALGVTRGKDGSIHLSPEATSILQAELVRKTAISQVPSTPRFQTRDAGGVGTRKGAGQWNSLSFEGLRQIRGRSPICSAIHAARHHQLIRLGSRWNGRRGDVGWRIVHKDHHERDARPPTGFQVYIDQFSAMLEKPSPDYCPTTANLLIGLWEDYATLNRPVLEKLTSIVDDSYVVGFRPVDAALIWETNFFIQQWLRHSPDPWKGYTGNPAELSADDRWKILEQRFGMGLRSAKYCLVRDGILEHVYQNDRLIVAPLLTSTDIRWNGYPPGKVEEAKEMMLAFINSFDYNGSFFTSGMMAEFFLGVSGDMHDDDVTAFQDQLREATQGVRRAWKPPILSLPSDGVIQKIDLKTNPKDTAFEGWMSLLLAMACAIYRMDPSTINAKPWDGGSGPSLSAPNRGTEIALAKEEGLQGDMIHLVDSILNPLARACHPDLRVQLEYGDYDPEKEARIADIQLKGWRTRNEIRLEQGLRPIGFWRPAEQYDDLSDEDKQKYDSNLWNMPSDPAFASQMMQQQQVMAQQLQAQQPQPDGFGGEADQPDGFGGTLPAGGQDPQGGAPAGARGGQPGAPPAAVPPRAGAAPPQAAQQPLQKGIGPHTTVFVVESRSRDYP